MLNGEQAEVQTKSKNASPKDTENSTSPKKDGKGGDAKLKKIMSIYSGHDLKFDKMSGIKRQGTPVHQMCSQDLPSPIANSRNHILLPYSKPE